MKPKSKLSLSSLAFIIILLVSSLPAWAEGENCFEVVGHEWGKDCGEQPGLEVKVKNTCDFTLTLSVCLEKEDGSWDCDIKEYMEPGAEHAFKSCQNTGKYRLKGCDKLRDCRGTSEPGTGAPEPVTSAPIEEQL